ncbi:MAG TPA: EAL domain-containing protein [Vicinamibacteria bacterium]
MDTTAEVLRAAALDLTGTLDLQAVLDTLLGRLQELVPYDTANVMLVEGDDGLAVRAVRGYEKWGRPQEVLGAVFAVRDHPVLGPLMLSGESRLIPDTSAADGWQIHPGAEHVRCWIGVPLVCAGRAIGLFAVDSPQVGFFDAGHVRLTEALAPHAAIAIQNARLFQALQASEARFRHQVSEFQTLLDVIPIGIAVARDPECRLVQGNRYLNRLLGLAAGANSSLSLSSEERAADFHFAREGRALAAAELPIQRAIASGQEVVNFEMEVVREGRKVATVIGDAAPLFDDDGRPRGAIGTALDITERKQAEEQVRSLAYHDPLTRLPNRLLFTDRLSLAVAQSHRHGQRLAVLFLDLDRFKIINDSLGHSVGDRFIADVAERLRACLREGDTVARLGGDEFTMLLPDISAPIDAAKVADKVLEALRQPFVREGQELFVTGSIGISLYPEDGRDAEALVKNADTAMYRAKEQGRDRYQLYAPDMNATARERLALESGLRKALGQGELRLHFQPILDLGTRRVAGIEALLRWQHPTMGLLQPADFVPLAEVTGLVLPMGPWVLRAACNAARELEAQGHPGLSVAVNLTARQFQQSDLPRKVAQALDEASLAPERLELEVTESSAMENPEAAAAIMRELKGLGVRISIDDFGTGYSSLSHLKRLPFDMLKIDKSFIRDITSDPDDAAIVSAVIAMAHTLKLRVVAEGVETEEQMRFLTDEGCDRVQGWLFSRPLPTDQLPETLSALAQARRGAARGRRSR